ncbi:MAG: hypothetical protein KDD04_08960, partial [Sinomicrobium sp.]|nr:hypothetical protein [Sinomicrobium sp.]
LCERYDLKGEKTAEELKPLIDRGIAYHHAGMLPTLKEVVEQLFTSKLLKLIFTTETFALGINMPAKTVIFDELRKFYGRSFSNLRTRDFYQMAGRAGRRSIDKEGFVFCRVNPHYISPEEVYRIIYSEPEKVSSQFNASYATVLNLYNHYGEKLYDIYPRSFHYFQKRKFLHKQALYFLKAKVDILKELNYIQDEQLTEKGVFASKVYGYEMILAELFDQDVLEQLSVRQLGILCLAVVYEPRKGTHKPQLTKETKKLEMITDKIIRDINRLERFLKLKDLSKRCFFHLTPAFEAWLKQESFSQILEYIDADEGEVVRYFRMTIQVLREIAETPISAELQEKIYQLIKLIDRGVIDSEKQLSV